MEPELAEQAIYSEFEDNLQIVDAETMTQWCQWVTHTAMRNNLPYPAPDARQVLIREAVRYTGEQDTLPLNPLWITRQFKEVAPLCEGETCNAEQFSLMLAQREWREGFWLNACRMKFCKSKSLSRQKASVLARSTPCR